MTKREIANDVLELLEGRPEAIVTILEVLVEESYAIASHLDENWQDRVSAKAWERIAAKIDKTAAAVNDLLPF